MRPPGQVLVLTRYDALAASSRVRILQFVPHLRERGIDVHVQSLLSNAYVEDLYAGRPVNVRRLIADYGRRVRKLLGAAAQVLWIEKELFPWLPYAPEAVLRPRARRVIVDYDDATWVPYEQHRNAAVRRLLGGKISRVMRAADAVTAGSASIVEYARSHGAREVVTLPSVVDLERYEARPAHSGTAVAIGWIGSPATAHYLEGIGTELVRLAQRRRIRLVCVGVERVNIPGLEIEYRPWSVEREAEEIRRFDIGIMPLADGEWERGKCGYKLIQYMASGVPAVGSAVGANNEIIEDGVSGRLVRSRSDWAGMLEQLMDDAGQRSALAVAGRKRVEEKYSVQSRLDQLVSILTP